MLRAGIILLASLQPVLGVSLDLWWDASPDPDCVGYVVYYGPVGSPTPSRADVGKVTTTTLDGFQAGMTYFFYLTAYDSAHSETDPSTVLNYTVPSATNVAPVLGTVLNWTVRATSNLTFTVSATDADRPAQILTFSLDPPVPAGASLDPASGVFNWWPTSNQIGTSALVFRVTDNGWPALSATRTSTITVLAPRPPAPRITVQRP